MKRLLLAVAVSAACASLAPLASAQNIDGSRDSSVLAQANPQRPAERGDAREGATRRFAMPSQRIEARLAYARTALKITDAQQPQWENFANVLRRHARAMDQRFQERRAQFEARRNQGDGARRMEPGNVNAIERLERAQQRMAERSARLNEVIAAAKPLYASFSPEQKQIADGMLARHGQGRGHHEHHRGMHRPAAA